MKIDKPGVVLVISAVASGISKRHKISNPFPPMKAKNQLHSIFMATPPLLSSGTCVREDPMRPGEFMPCPLNLQSLYSS